MAASIQLIPPDIADAVAMTDRRQRWLQRSTSLDPLSANVSLPDVVSVSQPLYPTTTAWSTRESFAELLGPSQTRNGTARPPVNFSSGARLVGPDSQIVRGSPMVQPASPATSADQSGSFRLPPMTTSGLSRAVRSGSMSGSDVVWTTRLPAVTQ